MNFGVKLKELRTEKKLTQLQMAEILETSKSNISKYEAGSVEPNLDTLLKISNFFGVPVDYILGNDNYNIDYTNNQTNTSLDTLELSFENKDSKYKGINGNIIKQLRKEAGLTQSELGKKIGVVKQTISSWENNISEPNSEILTALSKLFGVSISQLYGNVNQKACNEAETPPTPLTEREQNIIDIFRNLTDDNKDIIVGELKKTLRDQRRYEKDEPINYSKSDYDNSYKSLHREMRKAYLEDSANKNEVS